MSELKVRAKVAEGGRIVIPAKFRHLMGISVGDNVTLSLDKDELRVVSSQAALKKLQTLVRKHVPKGVSLVDELIRDRREEASKD